MDTRQNVFFESKIGPFTAQTHLPQLWATRIFNKNPDQSLFKKLEKPNEQILRNQWTNGGRGLNYGTPSAKQEVQQNLVVHAMSYLKSIYYLVLENNENQTTTIN